MIDKAHPPNHVQQMSSLVKFTVLSDVLRQIISFFETDILSNREAIPYMIMACGRRAGDIWGL